MDKKIPETLKDIARECAKSDDLVSVMLSGLLGSFTVQTERILEQLTRIADRLDNELNCNTREDGGRFPNP